METGGPCGGKAADEITRHQQTSEKPTYETELRQTF